MVSVFVDAQLGGDTEVGYHTGICKMAAVTNVAMERHNLPEALSKSGKPNMAFLTKWARAGI